MIESASLNPPDSVLTQLRKYYPNAEWPFSSSIWDIMEKFWNCYLPGIDNLIQNRYSSLDSAPRRSLGMFCAILLSVQFKITSYTKLADDLYCFDRSRQAQDSKILL